MISHRTAECPIDLILPELFATKGGIQKYGFNLICAIQKVRPNQRIRVFIRNDHQSDLKTKAWAGVEWYAAGRSNIRMITALLNAAYRSKPILLLSAHPNFAPLQWIHHQLTGSPSWCSAHGIDTWNLKFGIKRWALGRLQHLLPVSRFTAERLRVQLNGRKVPISILPNCFDSEVFYPGARPEYLLARYGLNASQPIVFTLSRLSKEDNYKHIDRLITAVASLLKQWPNLKLLVAGVGDDQPRLISQAHSLGIEKSIIFTGQLKTDEIADHHRLASIFALPSSGEGFGIVFLEALGCGKPVLAGNRDGSTDPLADGQHGLLVDPYLPLSPSLEALLSGKGEDLWYQPEKLAETVNSKFGISAFCKNLEMLLSNLETI